MRPSLFTMMFFNSHRAMPMAMSSTTTRWITLIMASVVLTLIAMVYWPGLRGPFLFDDYGNLDAIGSYGRLHTWPDLLYYLSSGTADPTGRPVALLSFLLDAGSWPADPWPFKRTNLILHLLNTALLAAVLTRLQLALSPGKGGRDASRWTPLAAAALWGAHPFFVSTTLYVIQREAMLPMAFVLLGMLVWMRAVSRFELGRLGAGWCWAILGVGTATLLAGLSKANGFLAPTLIGLAHVWFLRSVDTPHRRSIDRAAILCLGLPTLLLLAYLANMGWTLWSVSPIPARDWTLPERLLSEPRALWSYLWRLALPRAGGGGLSVEDFPASRGWLDPISTLPSIVALLAVTAAALIFRRRFQIASFAWLFFLAAHLLESTVVPLELYFEHRNYLAASMLSWPLAHVLLRDGSYLAYRRAAIALLLLTLLLLTRERATVWGDRQLLGMLSAAHESDSARAQGDAADLDIQNGRTRIGLARLHAMQRKQPESIEVAINTVASECGVTGAVAPDTMQRARRALATSSMLRFGVYTWMQDAAISPSMRHCLGFGPDGLRALLDSADANPVNQAPLRQRDLRHVRGALALADGNPDAALRWFDEALRLKPDPDYALTQAAALGNAGAPALGVQHLDHYAQLQATRPPERLGGMPGVHAWLLNHFGYYRGELQSLRQQLQADSNHAASLQRH